jgi:hypothetical protein
MRDACFAVLFWMSYGFVNVVSACWHCAHITEHAREGLCAAYVARLKVYQNKCPAEPSVRQSSFNMLTRLRVRGAPGYTKVAPTNPRV